MVGILRLALPLQKFLSAPMIIIEGRKGSMELNSGNPRKAHLVPTPNLLTKFQLTRSIWRGVEL